MIAVDPKLVAKFLKDVRGRNLPKGAEHIPDNVDKHPDGEYLNEGLEEVPIVQQVTGSGNGRFLG